MTEHPTLEVLLSKESMKDIEKVMFTQAKRDYFAESVGLCATLILPIISSLAFFDACNEMDKFRGLTLAITIPPAVYFVGGEKYKSMFRKIVRNANDAYRRAEHYKNKLKE